MRQQQELKKVCNEKNSWVYKWIKILVGSNIKQAGNSAKQQFREGQDNLKRAFESAKDNVDDSFQIGKYIIDQMKTELI